jgi:hypothetical protein
MSTATIFQIHLVSGYAVWALCFGIFVVPWLESMRRIDAFRAMAAAHSFRFFGLAFLVPGVVGADLPASFATFAGYGDLATGVLAALALCTIRMRVLFWALVVAFNLVGAADLIFDYYHAIQADLPAHAGQLGAMYAIPILYVPLLMLTHLLAFYWLLRREPDGVASAREGARATAMRGA